MSEKRVKAPSGYHWMKAGTGFKLMKHSSKFTPHKMLLCTLSLKFKTNIRSYDVRKEKDNEA